MYWNSTLYVRDTKQKQSSLNGIDPTSGLSGNQTSVMWLRSTNSNVQQKLFKAKLPEIEQLKYSLYIRILAMYIFYMNKRKLINVEIKILKIFILKLKKISEIYFFM